MNEIQSKLLEIFVEFDSVCKKLGIKYFAYGGTCLGAIRHKGFIPWDNDMDFMMSRADFDILVTKGNSVIKNPFFVQYKNTDKNWLFPFAKIRNSNTTAIEKGYETLDINHGLWIDVMPLDVVKNTKFSNFVFDKLQRFSICRVRPYLHTPADFFKKLLAACFYPTKQLAFNHFHKYSTKLNNSHYKYIRTWHVIYPRECFNDCSYIKFETTTMNASTDSIKLLEIQYGDWKKIPPLEQRVSGKHFMSYVDLNKSYKNYEGQFYKKQKN